MEQLKSWGGSFNPAGVVMGSLQKDPYLRPFITVVKGRESKETSEGQFSSSASLRILLSGLSFVQSSP